MLKGAKLVFAGAMCAVLAGCAGLERIDPTPMDEADLLMFDAPAVRAMQPHGPAFLQGLRAGYLALADSESSSYDLADANHFTRKAVASAKGLFVQPDQVALRDLDEDKASELGAARARLMDAFEREARRIAPLASARAQVAFDCWLEQEGEGDAEGAEACKARFEKAMAEVESALAAGISQVYVVFFAWDSADITPVARQILEQVAADYEKGKPTRLVLAGHADRSGPEGYNLKLSERRAKAVAAALEALGVARDDMKLEWYGESRPRVPTPDGVREPQNRRVEITFE